MTLLVNIAHTRSFPSQSDRESCIIPGRRPRYKVGQTSARQQYRSESSEADVRYISKVSILEPSSLHAPDGPQQ